MAGILLLVWVVISEMRRRVSGTLYRSPTPATGPRFDAPEEATVVEKLAAPKRLAGGPPQVSLQLKASEPSVRRSAVPFGKTNRPLGATVSSAAGVGAVIENFVPRQAAAIPEPERVEESVIESAAESAESDYSRDFMPETVSEVSEIISAPKPEPEVVSEKSEIAPGYEEVTAAPAFEEAPVFFEPPITWAPVTAETTSTEPAEFETPVAAETFAESVFDAPASFESVGEPMPIAAEIAPEPVATQAPEILQSETEPFAQGPPIPYQVPAVLTESPMAEITKPEPESLPARLAEGVAASSAMAGVGALRHSVESPSFAPQVISTEPLAQQPTTPATMPQPNQPTPAPSIRPSPMTGGAPQTQAQPSSGMQTAVQLTFSFEIASLQLTPSFKMGALQLKPTSKIVTMRLAPSQQPQPAMNLQVTVEIATVQAAGGGIGQIRLTPSQQQRPSVISTPSFNIAGLQLLSGADSGAVQLTPSQQGQASVHVTGRFQIATVEFSPSFEIASIVLNATSKSVSVQLPGAGPSAVEGAPVFEIANVQLTGSGEIGMMQLNAQGAAPKAA